MNVQIRWKSATRSRAVEAHLVRRLGFAVGRLSGGVASVRAWLEDVNGPRGGEDKRCAVELDGALGRRRVDVREVDFYVAIDRATGALARALARAADARLAARRGRLRRPVPAGAPG
jgi:putative sigma-54 modulation protein